MLDARKWVLVSEGISLLDGESKVIPIQDAGM